MTPLPPTHTPPSSPEPQTQRWLNERVASTGAVAGTVHRRIGELLHLVAHVNIPDSVVAKVRTIPCGKGMAGLAWQRRHAVSTCNLKTDETGDVRPGARAVDAAGAVAVPLFDAEDEVCAVVGFAFTDEQIPPVAELETVAADLPPGE